MPRDLAPLRSCNGTRYRQEQCRVRDRRLSHGRRRPRQFFCKFGPLVEAGAGKGAGKGVSHRLCQAPKGRSKRWLTLFRPSAKPAIRRGLRGASVRSDPSPPGGPTCRGCTGHSWTKRRRRSGLALEYLDDVTTLHQVAHSQAGLLAAAGWIARFQRLGRDGGRAVVPAPLRHRVLSRVDAAPRPFHRPPARALPLAAGPLRALPAAAARNPCRRRRSSMADTRPATFSCIQWPQPAGRLGVGGVGRGRDRLGLPHLGLGRHSGLALRAGYCSHAGRTARPTISPCGWPRAVFLYLRRLGDSDDAKESEGQIGEVEELRPLAES